MTREAIEAITVEISRFDLKPGDVVVIRYPSPIPAAGAAIIARHLDRILGPQNPVLILDSDVGIEIVGQTLPTVALGELQIEFSDRS